MRSGTIASHAVPGARRVGGGRRRPPRRPRRSQAASRARRPARRAGSARVRRPGSSTWCGATTPPANPETSLQAYVSNLRRALEPDRQPREPARLLVTQPSGYALLADRRDVDAARFEDLVARGSRRWPAASTRAAAERARRRPRAVAGPAAARARRRALGRRPRRLARRPHEHRPSRPASTPGWPSASTSPCVPRIERAVAEHPFQERLRAQQAFALYRAGRPARRARPRCSKARRSALVEEVGVEPGPELRRLEADILAQSPDLDAPRLRNAGARRSPSPRSASRRRRRRRRTASDGIGPSSGAHASSISCSSAARRQPPLAADVPSCISRRARHRQDPPRRGARRPAAPSAVVAWGRCPETRRQRRLLALRPDRPPARGRRRPGGRPDRRLAPDGAPAPPTIADGTERRPPRACTRACADLLATGRSARWSLVIDDLQWADPASLRLIEFVAAELQRTQGAPRRHRPPVPAPTRRPPSSTASASWPAQPGAVAARPRRPRRRATSSTWLRHAVQRRRTEADVADAGATTAPAATPSSSARSSSSTPPRAELDDPDRGAGAVRLPAAVQDVVRRRVGRLPERHPACSSASRQRRRARLRRRRAQPPVTSAVTPSMLDQLEPALLAGAPRRDRPPRPLPVLPRPRRRGPVRRAERDPPGPAPRRHRQRPRPSCAPATSTATSPSSPTTPSTAPPPGPPRTAYALVRPRRPRWPPPSWPTTAAAQHWARAVRALELARPGDVLAPATTRSLEQGRAHLRFDAVEAGLRRPRRSAIELAIGLDDPTSSPTPAAAMNVDGAVAGRRGGHSARVDAARRTSSAALAVMPEEPSAERVLALATTDRERLLALAGRRARRRVRRGGRRWPGRSTTRSSSAGRWCKRNSSLWWSSSLEQREGAVEELFDPGAGRTAPARARGPRPASASAGWLGAGRRGTGQVVGAARAQAARRPGRRRRRCAPSSTSSRPAWPPSRAGWPTPRPSSPEPTSSTAAPGGGTPTRSGAGCMTHGLGRTSCGWTTSAPSARVLIDSDYRPLVQGGLRLRARADGRARRGRDGGRHGPPTAGRLLAVHRGRRRRPAGAGGHRSTCAAAEELGQLLQPLAGRLSTTGSGTGLRATSTGALALRRTAAAGRRDDARATPTPRSQLLEAGGAGRACSVDALLPSGRPGPRASRLPTSPQAADALRRPPSTSAARSLAPLARAAVAARPLQVGSKSADKRRFARLLPDPTIPFAEETRHVRRPRPPHATAPSTAACVSAPAASPQAVTETDRRPTAATTRGRPPPLLEGLRRRGPRSPHRSRTRSSSPPSSTGCRSRPPLTDRTDDDHAHLDELMDDHHRCRRPAGRAARPPRRRSPAAARRAGRRTWTQHLDFEDADVLPLFVRHFTGDEYERARPGRHEDGQARSAGGLHRALRGALRPSPADLAVHARAVTG